jgi:hypothetical protein
MPWPVVAGDLHHLGAITADQLREVADLVSANAANTKASLETTGVSVASWLLTSEAQAVARRETDPASAVRVLDLWGWLAGISFDSRRVAESVTRAIDSR